MRPIVRCSSAYCRRLRDAVRGLPPANRAVVLCDPDDQLWFEATRAAREADPGLGAIAVVTRPSFALQRRARQRIADGRHVLNALVPIDLTDGWLHRAVADAIAHPGREGMVWLEDYPKHRDAPHIWPNGHVVQSIRADESLHTALVHAAGASSKAEAARMVGYTRDHLTDRLRAIRRDLHLGSDIALGAWAL